MALRQVRRHERHRRMRDRRGVLLLVALVLLVLFLLLGVTFVLMASNFRRSSEAYRRLQEGGDATAHAGDLLHGVARDLVRGTHNPESPFSKENLLEDMYGQPALRGTVTTPVPAVATGTGGQFTKIAIDADADFPNFATEPDGYYSGLVLTMLTGAAAHQSTRIVDSSSSTLIVMTKGDISATGLSSAAANGDLILINGRPFSGDGTGHATDATTRRLNEDYDAADLNNPWLAALSTVATQASWSDTGFFWGSDPVGTGTNRPGGTTPVVDNDADGIYESIWIDAGLPLQTQSDGTLVKPLLAMIVRDLDGRVNVNAHGSADQQAAFQTTSGPIGQGYGPAEIDPTLAFLGALGSGYSNPEQVTDAVLNSRHASATASDSDPGQTSTDDPLSAVAQAHQYGLLDDGAGGPNAFGIPHDIDGTSSAVANAITGQIEFKNTSGNTFTSGATNFQDDPYEMQLDTALGATPDDAPFTPDELERVFRHRDVDAGSLPDRLQTALTVVATDADKPAAYDRFRDLVTTESWDLPVHPVALPEECWDEFVDPDSTSTLTDEQKKLVANPAHITDLFKARMMLIEVDDPLDPGSPISAAADLQASLNQLITDLGTGAIDDAISREMLAGLKFNVNRLFGNGKDDNNNGVVDEPGESGETAYPGGISGAPVPSHFASIPFSYGDASYTTSRQARQQYAKQLYLLLMLISDIRNGGSGLESEVPTGTDAEKSRLLARRLAQFAVNAVDYRDADSIMTGFEYDANPFDGWDADGDLDDSTPPGNNDIGVVWGTEAPEAILTGTLALHDMRVKDTDADGGKTTETAGPIPDPLPDPLPIAVKDISGDFDQYAPPQGSLFLQIHALPNAYPTRDLFKEDPSDNSMKLELSKTHNDNIATGDPVWRVAISAPHPLGQATKNISGQGSPVFNQLRDVNSSGVVDPDEEMASQWSPLVTMQPNPFSVVTSDDVDSEILIERVVYFANTTGSATAADAQYYNQDSTDVLLSQGASMMVGPRAQTSVRAAGFTTDTVTSDVVCTLDEKPSGWTGDGTNPGMSVSEPFPDSYYTDAGTGLLDPDPNVSGDEYYSTAFDSPFDQTKELGDSEVRPILEKNDVATITDEQDPPGTVDVDRPSIGGTVENYCTAFLQRLANPLLPWNPLPGEPGHDSDPDVEVNPYITVDAMPIDLTVYNGDGDGVVWSVSAMTVATDPPPAYPNHFDSRGWRERAKLAEPVGALTSSLTNPSPTAITTASDPAPFWPNRPFVSGYELLMVPASEPGKLSFELGTHSGDPQANFGDGFPHLLNFFYEDSSTNVPRLGRLFDYLHVPSRYTGTQTTLRPDNFHANTDGFAPPFNRISNYREPGRVNLNTIEDASVWDSVMNGAPGDVTVHPGDAIYTSDIQNQLFRSSSYAELNGTQITPPAQASLLTSGGSSPMFADSSQTSDPFLRYGPINRLGNLVGTRSNVYAVWMTLGYFEVDPTTGAVASPPVEAGGTTGEIERHRAFYIIDRTIPVGYENGQDHNTDDVFRVQRFIE